MRDQHDIQTGIVTQDITIECVDAIGNPTSLDAALGYNPADPYAATATFVTSAGNVVWTFARELLIRGLSEPAGDGDVHIWPCLDARGRAVVIIELCSPDGHLLAQARTQDIYRFVNRTLALVPAGLESAHLDMDHLIDQLLRSQAA